MDKNTFNESNAVDDEAPAQIIKNQQPMGQIIYIHPALFEQAEKQDPEPEAA